MRVVRYRLAAGSLTKGSERYLFVHAETEVFETQGVTLAPLSRRA
jgi:hypothetical protein